MSEGSGSKKAFGCLAIVAVVAGVAGFIFRDEIARHFLSRKFPEEKLRELSSIEYPPGAESVAKGEVPWRRGKIFIAQRAVTKGMTVTSGPRELEPPRIDDDFFKLDSDIRASSPDDIDTLILVRRHALEVGQYVAKGSPGPGVGPATERARREVAKLEVYDFRNRFLVGEYDVFGPMPKFEIEAHESRMGEPADLVTFVASMPER